jgi:hypothetical protein
MPAEGIASPAFELKQDTTLTQQGKALMDLQRQEIIENRRTQHFKTACLTEITTCLGHKFIAVNALIRRPTNRTKPACYAKT